MTRRLLLRRKIRAAWKNCLADYNECRINSERSLQAAFWFHLSHELEISQKKPRRIFIEPHLRIEPKDFYPDIVICNSRQVIGVVELKYQPRKLPSTDKDIKTLTELDTRRGTDLSLRSRRYLGPKLEKSKYRFSEDVVFAGPACTEHRKRVEKVYREPRNTNTDPTIRQRARRLTCASRLFSVRLGRRL